MAEAIAVRDLSKTFHSNGETIKALGGVSLSVKEGEIFGLLGPNGAGKTTMISILAGIITPDSGKASILGLDCVTQTKQVQKRINVVSGFTGVLYALTCEQALSYYGLLYSIPDSKKRIQKAMEATDIMALRNQLTDELSSGQKQRFMIAKALINNPKVLIFDEPTVGLDVESAITIRNLVKNLRREGSTILLTTHNLFEAEELCDRVAFINHGKIIEIGTPRELKRKVVSKRAIEVHCSREDCVAHSLSGLKGIEATIKSPQLVHVSVDNYTRMKAVMKALAACDSEIYGVTELEPSLEETYLKLINKKGERHE